MCGTTHASQALLRPPKQFLRVKAAAREAAKLATEHETSPLNADVSSFRNDFYASDGKFHYKFHQHEWKPLDICKSPLQFREHYAAYALSKHKSKR